METEVGLELEAGGSSEPTMNVNNGGRPTCLYNDPSVFVKTEFDTGNHQPDKYVNLHVGKTSFQSEHVDSPPIYLF